MSQVITRFFVFIVTCLSSSYASPDLISFGDNEYFLTVDEEHKADEKKLKEKWHREAYLLCETKSYSFSLEDVTLVESKLLIISDETNQESYNVMRNLIVLGGYLEC